MFDSMGSVGANLRLLRDDGWPVSVAGRKFLALAESMTPLDQLRFRNGRPTPDSVRLAQEALRYLEQLPPRSALGVCLCSSVAWGVATPVSDVDMGVIVPSDDNMRAEKVVFEGTYVDYCEWPRSWVERVLTDPLANQILSYMVAFGLVIYDRDGWLAEAQQALMNALEQEETVRKWIDQFLSKAVRVQRKAIDALRRDTTADVFPHLFEGVRRVADAMLHRLPGGHCGEWPHRLREYSNSPAREWIIADAMEILAPLGVNLGVLASAVDPLACLHAKSAASPCGSSMGCSAIHGEFLARKARHYCREQDPLSLLQVLRKQMSYIAENVAAKEGLPALEQEVQVLRKHLREVGDLLRRGVPHTRETHLVSVDLLRQYIARTTAMLVGAKDSGAA